MSAHDTLSPELEATFRATHWSLLNCAALIECRTDLADLYAIIANAHDALVDVLNEHPDK